MILLLAFLTAMLMGQTITVTPSTTYQTMVGWEAVEQSCQVDCSNFATFQSGLFDAAVEMGINRIRLELLATSTCSAATWDYTDLDSKINNVVTPMRTRLAAQGETLWLNLCYVDSKSCYGNNGGPRPLSEYVNRFRLASDHINATFGFKPNSFEIALEPTVISPLWTPTDFTNGVPLLKTELINNGGIPAPYLIGPSTPGGSDNFVTYFDTMSSGARTALSELSYHRYDTVTASAITTRTASAGVPPSMLEHGNGDYNELHTDLKTIGVVAWEQFALAYPIYTNYENYQYFVINGGPTGTTFQIADNAKFLRQYFKYVRRGAQRIDASSGSGTFDPIAFKNTDGKHVVIVKATGSGSFTVGGLPAATYGIFYTTGSSYNQTASDQTISSGGTISTSIPAAGVLTIFAKTGASSSPATSMSGRVSTAGRAKIQ